MRSPRRRPSCRPSSSPRRTRGLSPRRTDARLPTLSRHCAAARPFRGSVGLQLAVRSGPRTLLLRVRRGVEDRRKNSPLRRGFCMLFLYTFKFDVDCTGHYQLYGFTALLSCLHPLYSLEDTGCVRAEHAYWRISWGALTLEVGKSPTEVPPGRRLPVAPPSAIIEFVSSSSPS